MRQLGDSDRKGLEPLSDVMRGSLAFQRGVHRQHHLVDPALGNAFDQRTDGEIFGPDTIQRG